MKKFVKMIIFLISCLATMCLTFAQEGRRTNYGSTPLQVFENVVGAANSGHDKKQNTALDGITDLQGIYGRQYKISNTLDYIRQNIGPYIQRAVYIGFAVSTTGLIVCGFLMVTGGVTKSSGFDKIKGRVINSLLGVFVLSGFYIIIKLMMGIINTFFGN